MTQTKDLITSIAQSALYPGETLIAAEAIPSGVLALSSERLLEFWDSHPKGPVWSIKLQDIAAVDIGWEQATIYNEVRIILFPRGAKPRYLQRPVVSHQDWKVLDRFPMEIASASGAPFAPPTIIPPNFKGEPIDTYAAYYYPKRDLRWPSRCPLCFSPLPDNAPMHSFVLNPVIGKKEWTIQNVARPIELHVPYCHQHYEELFKMKRGLFAKAPRPPINGYFDGLRVSTVFPREDYAMEFAKLNGTVPELMTLYE